MLEGWAGDLYGIPVDSTMEAMALGAQLEAMIIDPVYEGKSLAGLIDLVARGEIPARLARALRPPRRAARDQRLPLALARAGLSGAGAELRTCGAVSLASAKSTAARACSRVVAKTGTSTSSGPISSSISVQPRTTPPAPCSTRRRTTSTYAARDSSRTTPSTSSS